MSTFSIVSYPDIADLTDRQITIMDDVMMEGAAESIYQVEQKPYNTGNKVNYDEFDSSKYARRKDEGGDAEYADFTFGYNKTLTIETIALHVKITAEARKMKKYSNIANKIYEAANQCPKRI